MPDQLLRRVTTVHADATHRQQDVRIRGDRIEAVGDLRPEPGDEVVDLEGHLLLPAAVEPHAHLDKAFLAEVIENPTGDLIGAIEAMRANRHLLDVPETIERAERAARLLAANGFRAVRSHADLTLEHGLRSIEALIEVRRRVSDVIDLQVVALCGWPVTGLAGADQRALLHDAMDAGADVVGGCPHLEEGGDTRGPTELFLQVATDFGVGVDLHTDEVLDPTVNGLGDLAEMVSAGFAHPATASHCVSLGVKPEPEQREIADRVAAAGIGVVALPHTNLFLQGRGHAPMPRGLTAVDALMRAGVTVAAGGDNLQDPFNPTGRGCPFETGGLMIMTSHLLPRDAWEVVSTRAASVIGVEPVEITPASPADLVAVRATTIREAIAFGPSDRRVWRRGRRVTTG